MVTQALQPPTDKDNHPTFYCRSVRKTKGEVVLLEMSSKQGAKWLSNHLNRTDFIIHFNIDAQILEPTYKTKIEFVPVSLEVDNPFHHRDIESASDLPDNTISKITWMHKPTERKPQQKVAHTFLTFNSPEAANKAIGEGLTIDGKKVLAYHTYPEPMRCFRCQGLQKHLINDCPDTEDTCGTCRKHDHCTPQCTESNTDNFYSVNCRTHGHTSWDRECPTFAQEKEPSTPNTPTTDANTSPSATTPQRGQTRNPHNSKQTITPTPPYLHHDIPHNTRSSKPKDQPMTPGQ